MTTATEELVVTVTPRNRANFRRLKTNSIQSVKRWEKENELLYAMMEDESEWLAKLFPDVVISPDFFFYALEDGSLLCRLANYIQEKAELYSQRHLIPVPGKKFRYHTMSKCGKEIKLFRSRENVQQFLTWCRSHGIPEAILFESNDVVQVDDYREGCRGVIICLMEIVRRTAKFELGELPQLIQLEKEIEEDEAQSDTELSNGQGQVLNVEQINMSEIDNLEVQTDPPEIQSPSSLDSDSGVDSVFDQEEGDNTASRLTEFSQEETEKTEIITTTVTRKQNLLKPKDQKSSPKKTRELPSLLESTGPKSELDKQICKLAQNYNIKLVHRLKEGKYIILGRIMFVRMLNDHMLVRIGGGWDTLEHYLMTHAPSKEALETPSTPSSQAVTSPRNSISASSGARTSLIEKIKRKEQVGVVNRDSPVYSSQGSLHQQSGNQSSPKIKDRGKRSSLTNKDEKDISEAIRKISTSVSQTLADRPASFTAKTFSLLKSRFDKGIFGTSRRTSSPDLTQKGSKSRRRLSDTTTMADVATTLAFDGEQVSVANNNDSGEKQPEPGDTEETGVGKVSAPIGDLLGDESSPTIISPPEHPASDETDGSVPVGDLHSSEQSGLEDFLGAQQNGNANLVDISSFDPFASIPDQGDLISIDTASSEKPEEQPKCKDVVDNGELAHEEQLPEAVTEATIESSPPVDLGDLLQDTETKPDFDSMVEASPRPIDLGDLLQDSQTNAEAEGTVEPLPLATPEESVSPEEPVQETEAAGVELVKPDEPGVIEDLPTSVQEVPPFVVDPTPETEPEPTKVEEEPVKDKEPVSSEEAAVELSEPPIVEDESGKTEETATSEETVVHQPEPPKLEEEPVKDEEPAPSEEAAVKPPETPKEEDESGKTEEPTTSEGTVVQQAEPLKLEKEPAKVEASPSDEAVIKSEGESTEAMPVLDETTTQGQSQVQQAAVVQVIESAPVIADESKEGDKPLHDQTPKTEKPAEKVAKAKPAAAGAREKSPPKPSSAAKKPTGAAKLTSPGKGPPAAAGKKDVKAPTTKAPATRPASAGAPTGKVPAAKTPAAKAPVTKAPITKAAAAKTPASAAAGAKKPAAKPGETKVDGAKKPEKPKSAAPTRPSTKSAARPASAVDKKVPASTAKPAASKAPGKDVKDAGPPKSAPKTTTTRPLSAKPAPKTTAPGTKPASARPTRTQSAKPADSTDGTAPAKKPATRPTSAKPKTTTTTTTVKKTTTTTTTVTKSGTAAPAKTHTTTTKTVTQAKTGQPKTTTTTSTTTKSTAKPSAPRAALAAKKPDTKPAATGAKSKIGGKPSAGGKPAAKSAPKKKAEEPAKEKQVKQEEKPPVSQPEAATTTDEKPTEGVETKTDEMLTEKVETYLEERPVEASPEDQSTELMPDSAPVEPDPVDVSSDEVVEESSVVTRVVTTKTTTIIQDGEEESTTSMEESTFEQGES